MSDAALTAMAAAEYFLISYLLGSIPFGLLLAKLFGGKDVRRAGSGNIGATNVARVAGFVPGMLTLLLDAAKGAFAVLVAARGSEGDTRWMMLAGIGALVGHCFPVWLKFKGGKGVATAAGVFLVLCPPAFLGSVILFILVVAFWRYVSLGSISAAAAIPLLTYMLWAPPHAPPPVITYGTLAVALLIVYNHSANIRRLVTGAEPKFSLSRKRDAE
jgi:acyl phosphate:glycerol-3-phosphate acyltransferase